MTIDELKVQVSKMYGVTPQDVRVDTLDFTKEKFIIAECKVGEYEIKCLINRDEE